jgi:flagellin-specific chaperone FliS
MARNHQVAEKKDGTNMNEYFDKCNDVLAPLGHANRHINTTRRDFRKPELMSEYLHLCSHSVPFTKWLFGDDVSKTAKDIEDCSKIGNKLRLDVDEVDIEVAEVTVVVEVATVETEEPEAGTCLLGTGYQNIPQQTSSEEDIHKHNRETKIKRINKGNNKITELRAILQRDNEVSSNFKACVLTIFFSEWEKNTTNNFILDIVKHCHIEFIDNEEPQQKSFNIYLYLMKKNLKLFQRKLRSY